MGDSEEKEISKLKVADLKKELKSRGLSITGNKTELMERLQLVIKTDGSLLESDSVVAEAELLDDDEVLGGETEEGLDEEFLNKSDDLINSSTSIRDNKRPASDQDPTEQSSVPDKMNPPPAKKVVLNRSAAFTTSIPSIPEPKIEEPTTPVESDSEKNSDSKRIVKISSLTAKERLEMRARKFGVEPSDAAKKEMRAARFGNPAVNNSTSVKKTATSPVNNSPSEDRLRKRQERFGQLSQASKDSTTPPPPPSTTTTPPPTTTTTNGAPPAVVVTTDVDAKKQLRAERFKI